MCNNCWEVKKRELSDIPPTTAEKIKRAYV